MPGEDNKNNEEELDNKSITAIENAEGVELDAISRLVNEANEKPYSIVKNPEAERVEPEQSKDQGRE